MPIIDLTKADKLLFRAIKHKKRDLIDTALKQGANIEANDYDGIYDYHSPLTYAASLGHENVVLKLLEKGALVDGENTIGNTPLICAAKKGHEAVINALLDKNADREKCGNETSPLMSAVEHNNIGAVRILLARGAKAEGRNDGGTTPIYYIPNKEIGQLLIEHGVDIDARDIFGNTPLIYAARGNNETPDVINQIIPLIELGANIELKNTEGYTALDRAAQQNRPNIGKALLRAGAESRDDTKIIQWLAQMRHSVQAVFSIKKMPSRKKCFTDGKISDDVLDACATGLFGTLIAAPLIASKDPNDRQLFQDIWDQLPKYWQNRYGSLHAQFVKTGGVQPVMGHHTSAVASTKSFFRRVL